MELGSQKSNTVFLSRLYYILYIQKYIKYISIYTTYYILYYIYYILHIKY